MAFEELKRKQSATWGSAPFENVAQFIADVHADLVDRLEPVAGVEFLDVVCGTGGVAEIAAARGAHVTGSDFAPNLVDTARRRAHERGLHIHYGVADAEDLPYEDGSFDVVASCFGVIFAPDHECAAAELKRVTRSGGRLGLACWTPDGGSGDFFRLTGSFQPRLPPEAGRPLDWGTREHVRALLGDAFDLEFIELESPQHGESGEQLWELFAGSFGPVKTLNETLPPERRDEFERALVDFWERHRDGDVIRHERHYLVTLGIRR